MASSFPTYMRIWTPLLVAFVASSLKNVIGLSKGSISTDQSLTYSGPDETSHGMSTKLTIAARIKFTRIYCIRLYNPKVSPCRRAETFLANLSPMDSRCCWTIGHCWVRPREESRHCILVAGTACELGVALLQHPFGLRKTLEFHLLCRNHCSEFYTVYHKFPTVRPQFGTYELK